MRPMRRQDREVTDPEKISAVIDACTHCRLGFCDQGRAYIVPVNFGHAVENGQHVFYFHGAPEGRKIDLIRETGWAGIEMDEGYQLHRAETACGHTAAFRSIIGGGPIVILEDSEEKRRALAGVLAEDPRPSYQNDPQRVYGMGFGGLEVKFTVEDDVLTVREITPTEEK